MSFNKYIDPFSKKAKELSQQFDNANINKDIEKLYSFID